MRITARHSFTALAALTLLAACGADPEASPEPAPVEEIAPVETAPVPPPPIAESVVEAEPVEDIAPDAQVLQDADATGMTARVNREAVTENGESEDVAR